MDHPSEAHALDQDAGAGGPDSPPEGGTVSTSDLFDAAPEAYQLCDLPFRHFGRTRQFSGRCVTIRQVDETSVLRAAIFEAGEGRVLIVDGGSVPQLACLGDIMARRARDNGWAGVIVAGAIRDSVALSDIDLGVLALRTTAKRPFGTAPGAERDVALTLGGAIVRTGDWVFVDEDAVLVRSHAPADA